MFHLGQRLAFLVPLVYLGGLWLWLVGGCVFWGNYSPLYYPLGFGGARVGVVGVAHIGAVLMWL